MVLLTNISSIFIPNLSERSAFAKVINSSIDFHFFGFSGVEFLGEEGFVRTGTTPVAVRAGILSDIFSSNWGGKSLPILSKLVSDGRIFSSVVKPKVGGLILSLISNAKEYQGRERARKNNTMFE